MHEVVHRDEVHAGVRRLVGRPGEVEDGHVVVPVIKKGEGEVRMCVCLPDFILIFSQSSPVVLPFFARSLAPPTYQCKKMGFFPFKQIQSVSTNSATLERVNSVTHRPVAPSPLIL